MSAIGRESEADQLEKIFKSKQAEFVVVYGRRRIGKTFLIETACNAWECFFSIS